jgi:hypothetical protein
MAKTNSKAKQATRNHTKLEWLLFAALLLIGFLFLASHYKFWPLNMPKDNLGTAFYTSRKIAADANGNSPISPASTTGDSTGTAGRSTTTNSSTTTRTNASTGGSGTMTDSGGGSSSTAPLLSFAAGVNVGNSKQQVDATVHGLNENCAVTVNLPLGLGKQEVCTYTQNGGTVTVTYLNDHVLSASLASVFRGTVLK